MKKSRSTSVYGLTGSRLVRRPNCKFKVVPHHREGFLLLASPQNSTAIFAASFISSALKELTLQIFMLLNNKLRTSAAKNMALDFSWDPSWHC